MSRKSEELTAAIVESLRVYAAGVAEAVDELSEKKAKKLRKKVAADSPKRKGKYKKGWKVKQTSPIRGKKKFVVHNDNYRLPHLLEKGHALRRGGRTIGSVKPIPHIFNNAEEIIAEFERETEEIIEHGNKS